MKVLAFVSDPGNLTKLAANLDKLYDPTQEERRDVAERTRKFQEETQARIAQLSEQGATMENQELRDLTMYRALRPLAYVCPSLSRDTSAAILGLIADAEGPVPVHNDLEYVADGGCEWAYVVDLDAGVLEVYAAPGGGGTREDETRFHQLESVKAQLGKGAGPVLRGSWKFSELPTESAFVEETSAAGGERE